MVPFPDARLCELATCAVGGARNLIRTLRRPLRLLPGFRAGHALARDCRLGHLHFAGPYATGSPVHRRDPCRLALPGQRGHLVDLQARVRVLHLLLCRRPLMLGGRRCVRRQGADEWSPRILAAELRSSGGVALMTRVAGRRQHRETRRVLHDLLQGAEAGERGGDGVRDNSCCVGAGHSLRLHTRQARFVFDTLEMGDETNRVDGCDAAIFSARSRRGTTFIDLGTFSFCFCAHK